MGVWQLDMQDLVNRGGE